ncbi:hypothetical protein LZ32DRAFT_621934, partial [Colletotrichum eremochloae]
TILYTLEYLRGLLILRIYFSLAVKVALVGVKVVAISYLLIIVLDLLSLLDYKGLKYAIACLKGFPRILPLTTGSIVGIKVYPKHKRSYIYGVEDFFNLLSYKENLNRPSAIAFISIRDNSVTLDKVVSKKRYNTLEG